MSNEITDLYLKWEQALSSETPDAALVASIEDKAREKGFDFITVNEAMVARGGWRADLHPRGKDGRFINVGLLIDLLDFDLGDGRRKDRRGEVTAIRPNRNSPGNPDIQVDVGGKRVWVKPNAVSAAKPSKGRIKKLDSPDIAMYHDDEGGLDVVAKNVADLGMELDSPEIAMFHADEGGSDVVARNAAEFDYLEHIPGPVGPGSDAMSVEDELEMDVDNFGNYDWLEGFSTLSNEKQVTIKERMATLRTVTDAHLAEMRETGTDSPTEKVLLDAEYQRRQAGFKSNAEKIVGKTEIEPGSDFGIPVVGNDTLLVDADGMPYVPYVDDAGTEWPYPDPMGQAPSMTGDFPGTLMSPVSDGYENKVSLYFVLDTDAEAWVVANPGIAVYSQESHDFYEGAKGSTKTDWTPGYISGDMRLSKGVNLDDPKLVTKRSDEVEMGDRIFFEGADLDPGSVLTVRRIHHLPIEPGSKDRDPVIEAVDDNDVFHTLSPLADQRVDIIDEPQIRYERDTASDTYHAATRELGVSVLAVHPEAKRMPARTMTPESNIIDVDPDGSLRVRKVSEVGHDDTTHAVTFDFDDGSSLVTAPEYNYWTTNWNYGKDPMEGVERMPAYVRPESGPHAPVPPEGQTINALRDLGYSDPIAAPSGNAWMMTNPTTNYQTMFYKNKDRVIVYNDNWGSSTPVFDGTFDEFMSNPHIAGIDPSIGTDALAAAVETLLARGKWDPDLHPRGKDGKFINVLGLIKMFDFDIDGERVSEGRGRVTKIVPDKKSRGNPDIQVELPDGRMVTVKPSQVTSGPKVKASLRKDIDAPDKVELVDRLRERVHPVELDSPSVEMTDAEYDARAEMLELDANPLLRSQRADQLSEGDTFIDSDGEIAVVETIDDSTPDDGFVTVITTQGKVRALKPDDEVGMDAGNVPPSKKASDLRTGDNFIDHKGDLVTVGEFEDKDFDDTSITVITTGEKIRELKPNDEVGMNALPDSDDAPTSVAPKIDYSPEAMQARDERMGDPAEQARRLEGLGITPGPEYGYNPTGVPYKDIPAEDLGSKENPIRTNDPMLAVQALHDGKHVELQQIDQVSTMLDELGRIANEAREKGVDAGDYDLCKVTVPDTNLFCIESKGIPRIKMPQLSGIPTPGSRADRLPKTDKGEVDIGPAFVAHLEAKGISVTETRLPASHLRASQNELVGAKVSGMMGAMQSGNPKAIQNIRESAIFTTADNYVVDGHHRWAAVVGLDLSDGVLSGDVDMPVRQIDMDILDVLNEAYAFAIDFGIPPKAGSGVEGGQEEAAATVASLRSRVHSGGSNQ